MKFFTTLVSLFLGFIVTAQDSSLVHFFIAKKQLSDTIVAVSITAKPVAGIKLFSVVPASKEIPVNSTVMADTTSKIKPLSELAETGNAIVARDTSVGADVKYYTDSVVWTQNFSTKDSGRLAFLIDAFINNKGELVSLPREVLKISLAPQQAVVTAPDNATPAPQKESSSLPAQALVGLLLGFAAVFTPVFFRCCL